MCRGILESTSDFEDCAVTLVNAETPVGTRLVEAAAGTGGTAAAKAALDCVEEAAVEAAASEDCCGECSTQDQWPDASEESGQGELHHESSQSEEPYHDSPCQLCSEASFKKLMIEDTLAYLQSLAKWPVLPHR